ncbi:MAG: hypothetical protein V4450_03325 [Bacteroidota bacterium]
MKRILNTVLFVMGILLTDNLYSQQVSGHWYGIGMLQTTGDYNSYLSEMILRQKGKLVWGELDYYFKDSLVKVALNGTFDEQTRKLNIKPFPMIYYRSPNAKNSIDVFLSGSFNLLVSKTESVLNGVLQSDDAHKYTVPEINYRFTRSDDTAVLIMKDEEPEIKKEPPVIAVLPVTPAQDETTNAFTKRTKIYTKEIDLENKTIRLELYDNGEIDGDIISLFFNGKVILSKTMLTHKAIRLTIELDTTLEFNELSMFAENLGTIPPNTAALVVYDGKTRYETLLSSDLSKSATLKLKQKK